MNEVNEMAAVSGAMPAQQKAVLHALPRHTRATLSLQGPRGASYPLL